MDEEESATITSLCEEVLSVIFDHVPPTTALEASLVRRNCKFNQNHRIFEEKKSGRNF